jgi:hypothetical protein
VLTPRPRSRSTATPPAPRCAMEMSAWPRTRLDHCSTELLPKPEESKNGPACPPQYPQVVDTYRPRQIHALVGPADQSR